MEHNHNREHNHINRHKYGVHRKISYVVLVLLGIMLIGLFLSQYSRLNAFADDNDSHGGLFGRMQDGIQKVIGASFDNAEENLSEIATLAGITPEQADIVLVQLYTITQETLRSYMRRQMDKALQYSGRNYRTKKDMPLELAKVYAD